MLEDPRAVSFAEPHSGSASTRCDNPPIDLVHLTRQCQGDPDLEEELLALFWRQAPALAAQLSDPSTHSPGLKADVAHKLRGSALTVGAARVARAAWAVEEDALAARDHRPAAPERPATSALAIAALREAVAEAVAEIERLRG